MDCTKDTRGSKIKHLVDISFFYNITFLMKEILDYCDDTFRSVKEVVDRFSLSRSTAYDAMKRLKRRGFVFIKAIYKPLQKPRYVNGMKFDMFKEELYRSKITLPNNLQLYGIRTKIICGKRQEYRLKKRLLGLPKKIEINADENARFVTEVRPSEHVVVYNYHEKNLVRNKEPLDDHIEYHGRDLWVYCDEVVHDDIRFLIYDEDRRFLRIPLAFDYSIEK